MRAWKLPSLSTAPQSEAISEPPGSDCRHFASRPKSALHQVSYRWNHHFTDDAGGLAIPATIDTTSSVEHLFHHRRRWNYYSSDNRHRLISGATIPATLTLD